MSRISTSSSGGSVNIQDSNGNALNSTNGALDVNVVSSGAGGTTISLYNEITNVAMAASATILTYTVPNGSTLNLTRILSSSDSIGTIEVDLNGVANAKGRLTYTYFNTEFNYLNGQNGFSVPAGTVISVTGTNSSLQGVASFNATLQGVLM